MKALLKVVAFWVVAMACATAASVASLPEKIPQNWVLRAELTGSDSPSLFGYQVATNGDTVVAVGSGLVYVFVRPAGGWTNMTQTAELTASDGDLNSVAISGDTIVAGSNGVNGASAAYVFVKPSGGWKNMTETAKLTASDAAAGDFFGFAVAIAGGTIVVGAPQNNAVGAAGGTGPGAVYVFVKPAGGWKSATETAKFTASDGYPGDDLGWSVAILGDTVAAGAPDATVGGNQDAGAVYAFQRKSRIWNSGTESAKLTASDASFATLLGTDVGMSGATIAASGIQQVYIYSKPAGGWISKTQTAELQDSLVSFLVQSVAISGRFALGGMPNEPDHGIIAMYIEPRGGWVNEGPSRRFRVPADNGGGSFGWSVSIKGTTLVIGSPLVETYSGGNIVYVYGPA